MTFLRMHESNLRRSLIGLVPALLFCGAGAFAMPQEKKGEQHGHEGHDHGQEGHDHDGHDHDGHNHGAQKGSQGQVVKGKDGSQKRTGPYGGTVDQNAKLLVPDGTQNHDFGRVLQGTTLNHNFKIKSDGSSPLVVRQVKPTCGCTVSQVQLVNADGSLAPYNFGDPVEPGRELSIEALLDTANKHNKTQVRINIYANDPVGVHNLGLTAQVDPYMTVTPSFVNFGDLNGDSVKNSTIDVRVNKGDKVLLSIDDTRKIPVPEGMTVNLVPVNPDDAGKSAHWQVKLDVGPGLKEGPLGYAMTLKTDQEMLGSKPLPSGKKRFYQVNANVNGRVLGVLSCSPQYLSMGLVAPGQVIKRQVQLTSHDPEFQIGNPKVTLRGFKGGEFPWKEHFTTTSSPIPNQSGVAIELRLDGLPDGSDGSFKGEMVVETGHPQKPEVVVTFSGVCRGSVGRTTGRPNVGTQKVNSGRKVGAKPIGAKPVSKKAAAQQKQAIEKAKQAAEKAKQAAGGGK